MTILETLTLMGMVVALAAVVFGVGVLAGLWKAVPCEEEERL